VEHKGQMHDTKLEKNCSVRMVAQISSVGHKLLYEIHLGIVSKKLCVWGTFPIQVMLNLKSYLSLTLRLQPWVDIGITRFNIIIC
jgi:hypothetical protein